MRAFTYDAESVDLTKAECAGFAGIVVRLCYPAEQHSLSLILVGTDGPKSDRTCDSIQRQARKIWRTEARL